MLYQVSKNPDDAPVTMGMALMMAAHGSNRWQNIANTDRQIAREHEAYLLRVASCCKKEFATKELKVKHQNDSFNFGHGRTD